MAGKSVSRGVEYRGKGWRIRIWAKGKLIHSETIEGPPTAAAQRKAVAKREHLLSRQKLGLSLREGDGGEQTFREVVDKWYKSLQLDSHTEKAYWNMIDLHWMPHFEKLPISAITQPMILEVLGASGLSRKTQKNITDPLRAVLRHGGANPNPAMGIKWPKRENAMRKTQRYLPEERKAIIDALVHIADKAAWMAKERATQLNRAELHWSRQARFYFPLLFATGLRPGEALGLLCRDYDGQFLNVDKQYTKNVAKATTKTGRARRVFVPQWFRPTLDDFVRFREGPIFTGSRGGALKDTKRLNPIWEKAHNRARLPYRDPYVCRHTRASELLSNGVMPAEAADYLGHTPETFLGVYATFVAEFAGERDWSRFESTAQTLTKDKREAV